MTEDQFPDVLRQAAKHYNTPPPTPREAMWARIQAERQGQTRRGGRVIYLPWVQWCAAAAAVLVLGIGLGRISVQSEPTQTVAVAPAVTAATPTVQAPAPDAASSAAYQLAATEHLSRVESLLTSFRGQAAAGETDAQVTAWATDLLGNTRLLLDSPAAQDPQLRVLLQDLELVLAQISQLPTRRPGEELDLIERSLEQGGVLPRLRTAVPAGPATTQT